MRKLLRNLAQAVEREIAGVKLDIQVQPQYRNMAEGLQREPRAVQFAQEAHARLGRTAQLTIIRGGTDGSMLTAKGLPTPNLSSGQHTPTRRSNGPAWTKWPSRRKCWSKSAQVWSEKGRA